MPSANNPVANATLLPFDTLGDYDLTSVNEQFFYLTPTVTGSYRFKLDKVSGASGPYCDVYRLTEGSLAAFTYDTWIGWCGDDFSGLSSHEESCVELIAGETYVVPCYNMAFATGGTYTLEIEEDIGPANDRVIDATLVATGPGVEVIATTAGGSQEEDEFNNWDGSQAPSVWYKVVIGGPGVFSYDIESTTPGFNPNIQVFYATGPVNSFSDLTSDGPSVGDGTEDPPGVLYGGFQSDLDPLQGGEIFYLRISSDDSNDASDFGAFVLTVSSPPDAVCLDAVDYINGGSATASVVGGAVRETQLLDESQVNPYESFISDQVATLVIPGDDILDGAGSGFYWVSLKTKNATQAPTVMGGFKRNGQPIYPGSFIDTTSGSTPVVGWLTLPAGTDVDQEVIDSANQSGFADSQYMVWYLPVKSGDEIEVIVSAGWTNDSPSQIDITQICFQRALDAVDGPAYDILDVPDHPLGMGDVTATPDKMGPIPNLFEPTTAVTFERYTVEGMDMCVTDDGTVWVLCTLRVRKNSGADVRYIGPALVKWNGSSWSVIDNDVEGLGFKRTTRDGAGGTPGGAPYGVSMDTDGEDIWVAYGVRNTGAPLIGGFPQIGGRVRKYDVSGASWTTLGGFIHTDPQPASRVNIRSEVGGFDTSIHLKVSPGGTPWVSFCDWTDGPLQQGPVPNLVNDTRPPFTARWTGSDWDVQLLPAPGWNVPNYNDNDDVLSYCTQYQAESILDSGTSDTFLGDACASETKTTHDGNKTVKFTPPAGQWMVIPRGAKSGSNANIGAKIYKDGVEQYFGPSSSTTDHWVWTVGSSQWTRSFGSPFYFETDGAEEVEISFRLASGTGTIYIDDLWIVPAWFLQQGYINSWGAWYIPFVEDAQYHVQLAFPDGENPVCLYNTASLKANTTNPDDWGYLPPNVHYNTESGAPDFTGTYLVFPWIYSRWDGSAWDKVWDVPLLEEEIPNHITAKTLYRPYGISMPVGNWEQGMAMHAAPDGTVYVAAGLGISTNGADNFIAFVCGENGMETPWTRPPGITGGAGYSGNFGWLESGWDCHANSIVVTGRNKLFIGYSLSGVPDLFECAAVTFAPNGIGDWFLAAEENLPIGYTAIDQPAPVLKLNPAGDTVYILDNPYIYDRTLTPDENTFGVWECPIIEDAKIPLIPIQLAGEVNMNIRTAQRADVSRLNQ